MSIGRLILPLVVALWLWQVAAQAQPATLMCYFLAKKFTGERT